MAFNIETFKNRAGQNGFLKNNKFRLVITLPEDLLNVFPQGNRNVVETLSYMCDATSLPSIMHGLHENRRFGYGPVERKPYFPNYNDLMVDILVDGKADSWRVLYTWLQSIMNSSMPLAPISRTNRFGLSTFEVNYKENYRSTIALEVFNDTGTTISSPVTTTSGPAVGTQTTMQPATIFTFSEAFPTSIMESPLNWGSSGLLKIQTNWSFHTWSSVIES